MSGASLVDSILTNPFVHETITLLTSETAVKYYIAVGLLFATLGSLAIAYLQQDLLSDFKFTALPKLKTLTLQGGLPGENNVEKIEEQLKKLQNKRAKITRPFRMATVNIILCGLIVPSILFLAFIYRYSYFVPDQSALIDGAHKTFLNNPSLSQAVWAVASQLALGISGIVTAVAKVLPSSVANVTYNTSSEGIGWLFYFFRIVVTGFATGLVGFVTRYWWLTSLVSGKREAILNRMLARYKSEHQPVGTSS